MVKSDETLPETSDNMVIINKEEPEWWKGQTATIGPI